MESSIRGGNVRFERNREHGSSEWGHFVDPCRKDCVRKDIIICRRTAVLWIDEKTGDYVVAWIFNYHYLFSYKKGDDSWWNWNNHLSMESLNFSFLDLAYRNSKLYLYTTNGHIKIVDFSGNDPIEMNLESNIWERVESIGDDEMLIFGHGVTIRAPVQEVGDDGIKSGSICFVRGDIWPTYYCSVSNCGVFDLATSIIKWPKEDEAHIFCKEDQIEEEVKCALDLVYSFCTKFGFTYQLKLLRFQTPEKHIGDLETWDRGEEALKNAIRDCGKPLLVCVLLLITYTQAHQFTLKCEVFL
ncbi:unnamed protein product [Arabidopsis halleri]